MPRWAADVPAAPEAVFDAFVTGIGEWWPAEYTWSQDVLEGMTIEPREGGLCSELGPNGFRCDWGAVLAWEPPGRLVLAWQVSARREPVPDPAKASEVEVRFDETGAGVTHVEFEHRAFERHGEGAEGYREAMASPQGWPFILDRFAAFASAKLS